MNEIVEPASSAIIEELNQKVPSREQIERLQVEVSKLPQAEDMETTHYFSNSMYGRKLAIKAGTLVVGKVHKQAHLFICAGGEMVVWTENGMKNIYPGDIIESKEGTKRVILALVDSIMVTVHKTDKTDLDEIEEEIIEPDETALFDSSNNLKQIVLEGQKMMALKGN